MVDPLQRADVADVELIGRIAAGDRGALTELYERHAGWLTVRLGRRCGDPDLVDTALQDTFLAAWRQADRYRPTGEVGAWLWTIAVRRLIDQVRRRPPPEPTDEPERMAAVMAEEIPIALGHTDMGQAFAALEPELQAVLVATALDGLTNREAAGLLGVPVGTVKSRLSRARQLLKEALR
ncbi:MAG: RNA polymerase sigma factor [Acidimicrobiales bacterium]